MFSTLGILTAIVAAAIRRGGRVPLVIPVIKRPPCEVFDVVEHGQLDRQVELLVPLHPNVFTFIVFQENLLSVAAAQQVVHDVVQGR